MQVNAYLRGTAILTIVSPAVSQHFTLPHSKMATKTTSGSGFDLQFRLNASGFVLESGFVANYLHALGHFSP